MDPKTVTQGGSSARMLGSTEAKQPLPAGDMYSAAGLLTMKESKSISKTIQTPSLTDLPGPCKMRVLQHVKGKDRTQLFGTCWGMSAAVLDASRITRLTLRPVPAQRPAKVHEPASVLVHAPAPLPVHVPAPVPVHVPVHVPAPIPALAPSQPPQHTQAPAIRDAGNGNAMSHNAGSSSSKTARGQVLAKILRQRHNEVHVLLQGAVFDVYHSIPKQRITQLGVNGRSLTTQPLQQQLQCSNLQCVALGGRVIKEMQSGELDMLLQASGQLPVLVVLGSRDYGSSKPAASCTLGWMGMPHIQQEAAKQLMRSAAWWASAMPPVPLSSLPAVKPHITHVMGVALDDEAARQLMELPNLQYMLTAAEGLLLKQALDSPRQLLQLEIETGTGLWPASVQLQQLQQLPLNRLSQLMVRGGLTCANSAGGAPLKTLIDKLCLIPDLHFAPVPVTYRGAPVQAFCLCGVYDAELVRLCVRGLLADMQAGAKPVPSHSSPWPPITLLWCLLRSGKANAAPCELKSRWQHTMSAGPEYAIDFECCGSDELAAAQAEAFVAVNTARAAMFSEKSQANMDDPVWAVLVEFGGVWKSSHQQRRAVTAFYIKPPEPEVGTQ